MDGNLQDHNMAIFASTLGSSQFQTPALPNTEVMLSQSTSLPHGNVQNPWRLGLWSLEWMLMLDNLTTETADKPRADLSSLTLLSDHFLNEFDWALQECENLNIIRSITWFYPRILQSHERRWIIHIPFNRRMQQPRDPWQGYQWRWSHD